MPQVPRIGAVLGLIALCLLQACRSTTQIDAGNMDASRLGSSAERVRDGLGELQAAVNLTVEPDELLWTEEVLDGRAASDTGRAPGAKRLVAVLRFDSPRAAEFQGVFSALGAGMKVDVEVEEWFPTEMKAQGQTGGGGSLKGVSVPANSLLRPPYQYGRLIKVDESPFYILELFSA